MTPRGFKLIGGALVVGFLILLIAQVAQSGDSARGGANVTTPTGFYPPAPSKAVGMTPEWFAFAGAVDRICAVSFNQSLVVVDQVERLAAQRGWSDGRLEHARLGIWNDQAATILRSTKRLGEPPERPGLFARWRANVAERAALRNRAAEAAGSGRWSEYRSFMRRVGSLKDRSDEIGQRFGLRICTSN